MHSLVFELNSIQPYLFASGRLRDVAGASELLDQMTDGDGNLLDNVLNALGMGDGKTIRFSRRAGGAIYAFCDDRDELMRFLRLWTLAVQQWAPGMDFSLGMGEGCTHAEAFDAARRAMNADANRKRPNLPPASPLTSRSRRTGLAAIDAKWRAKDGPMDAPTARKKQMADLSKAGFLKRFAPPDADLKWRDWPTDLEGKSDTGAFPFAGDDRTVALIHADGNGLGQLLMHIRDAAKEDDNRFVELFRAFSNAVAATTQSAAQQATEKVLLPVREKERSQCLAARPILLGGDDITVIVRADLAMEYCKVFAEAFESASREELKKLGEDHSVEGLPKRLTLGFGLVFLRASQPFHMAIHLAEDLLGEAKKVAKALNQDDPESSIAFHRITGSLVDDYEQIVARVLSHRFGDETFIDTLGVYYFKEQQPCLDDLLELARTLGADDMARGPTRQLMTLMGHDKAQAERRYRRWRRLMADDKDKTPRLKKYDELMNALSSISKNALLPYDNSGNGICRSPLGDALALLSLTRAQSGDNMQRGQAA